MAKHRAKHAAPKSGPSMAVKAPAAVAVGSLAMSSLAIVVAAPANAATTDNIDPTTLAPASVDGTVSAEVVNAKVAVTQYLDARVVTSDAEASRSARISTLQKQVKAARTALADAKFNGHAIVGIANDYRGVPYVTGGSTPNGFDCSGYTQYVYRQMGIDIPRVAQAQANWASPISHGTAKPGDFVFFHTGTGYVYHVGIYAGNGMMWHSPHPGASVRLAPLYSTHVTFGRAPQSTIRPSLAANLARKTAELSATKNSPIALPTVKLRVVKPIAASTYQAPHAAN